MRTAVCVKQVPTVADGPERQNRAVDRAYDHCDKVQATAVASRVSGLGGTVNLVNHQRFSLSRSERPPFSS